MQDQFGVRRMFIPALRVLLVTHFLYRTTSYSMFSNMASRMIERLLYPSFAAKCSICLVTNSRRTSVRRLSSRLTLKVVELSFKKWWHPNRMGSVPSPPWWRTSMRVSHPWPSLDCPSAHSLPRDYVLQRAVSVADQEQKQELISRIKPQLVSMRRYSSAYSKHLLSSELERRNSLLPQTWRAFFDSLCVVERLLTQAGESLPWNHQVFLINSHCSISSFWIHFAMHLSTHSLPHAHYFAY
jgi:hypothetical protein